MGELMFWTGVITWALIGAALLWLIGEIAWGFVCAASYNRWVIRRAILDGRLGKLRWRKLPSAFLSDWWHYVGYRNDGSTVTTATSSGSQWRGVGDYTLYPENENGATHEH